MNTIRLLVQCLALAGFILGGLFVPRPTHASRLNAPPVNRDGFFVQNVGQFKGGSYLLRGKDGDYWFDANTIRVMRSKPVQGTGEDRRVTQESFEMQFKGANPQAVIEPAGQLSTHLSYLLGSDPAGWFSDVPVWSALTIKDLYPGLDLEVKGASSAGGLVWRWLAQPGADLTLPKLEVKGAVHAAVDNGVLQVTGTLDSSVMDLPFLSGMDQPVSTAQVEQSAEDYVISQPYGVDGRLESALMSSGVYQYLSYLGGSAADTAYSVAAHSSNAYVTGATSSPNFPITVGAVDTVLENTDAYVVKWSSDGSSLVYATFMGGPEVDRGNDIAVENGYAYITGETNSTSFPGIAPWAYRSYEMFVVKLNLTGTALMYAKRFGGAGVEEDYGYGVAVEGGYAYLTGGTNSSDFADQDGLLCSGFAGDEDIIAIKLNQSGSTAWIKCIGGSNIDAGFDIAVSGGVSYITGESNSRGVGGFVFIPSNTAAYVLKVSAVGSALWIKAVDGGNSERGNGIAYDSSGNIYVTGITNSSNFLSGLGASPIPYGGGDDAFLVRLNSSGTADFRTFLGGAGQDRGYALAVDIGNGIQVIGDTASTNFPVSADAVQPSLAGGTDAFVSRFVLSDANKLKYSSYLGGSDGDYGRGLAIDVYGYTLAVGETNSANLPVTAGAMQTVYAGLGDAYTAKIPIGPVPAVVLKVYTNELDADLAPGPYVNVGSTVTWRYEVFNAGSLNLINLVVTDDRLGQITCPKTSLTPGETMSCTHNGTVTLGQYANLGTVTGKTQSGLNISDTDPSHYFGANPETVMVKKTNLQDANASPGVLVEEGSPITWTYEITNNGNVELTNIMVVDDNGSPGNTADDFNACGPLTLAVGATTTCTKTSTAVAGQYGNIAVVTANPPGSLAPVSDSDPSYYFGSKPGLSLVKKTNGTRYTQTPGLYLPEGGAISWTYEVKNTGNVTLTNVTVVDDMGPNPESTICTIASLAVNATQTCSKTGIAAAGQYTNLATVTGTPPVGANTQAQDRSYYFGVHAAVALEFKVNDDFADAAPGAYLPAGSTFTWRYQVTNNSNVPYTGVVVKDNNGTVPTGDDITVCTIASLAAGASQTCERSGTAVTGAFSASATVTGNLEAGLAPTATDPAYYFGAITTMTLVKKTNAQDVSATPGVYVLTGSTVNWDYILTNTGNVTLTNISVVDDPNTPGNSGDDDIVCTGKTLTPTQQTTCTWSDTARAGQYTNNATATGSPPGGLSVITAQDTSYYFGVTPTITLEKKTNNTIARSPTGPMVLAGSTVNWSYTVTNTGDIALTNVSIKDNNGTPGNTTDDFIVCSIPTLANNTSQTCSKSGTAIAGQYANIAIVTASPPSPLTQISAQDISHYFGVVKSISIVKKTNDADANTTPGPVIRVGDAVNWTYTVKNTGNVNLTGIAVTDDKGVTVTCGGTSLAPNAEMTCTASGVAVAGQYSNIGSVTANAPVPFGTVTASDPSHYFGTFSKVTLKKYTNGDDADTGTGPYILVGQDVNWTYVVKNEGNDVLSGISVTDNKGVTVSCPSTTLNPGTQMTCTASAKAVAGQYSNIGTVTANPPGPLPPVTNSDPSHYFGANPSIQLVKKTNGQDANEPPGQYIPAGEQVTYNYEVTNQGNLALTEVTVTDDHAAPVSCPGTQLAVGESMVCTATVTAETGQHASTGLAHARDTLGMGEASASDISQYFGFYLGLSLVKMTNGKDVNAPPGPELLVGNPVTWTYDVKNLGNVAVSPVKVTDSAGVTVNCPKPGLVPMEMMRCSAVGTVAVGPYVNTGTARVEFTGKTASAEDQSYYTGIIGYNVYLPITLR